jgi:sugar phosphate isomerase/epimerase
MQCRKNSVLPGAVPRFSLNQVTTLTWSFERDLDAYAEAGVPAVGISVYKLEAVGLARGIRLVGERGLPVSCLTSSGPIPLEDAGAAASAVARAREHLAAAAELGAACLMLLPGTAPGLAWDEAARRAGAHVEALRADARRLGVRLAIEPVSQLRMDLCFLHSFHDALDFCDQIGAPEVGVVLELNNAWIERHLDADVRTRTDRIAVVQVSDFKVGTLRASERVVMGDGDIPLRRHLHALHAAGYRGWYDVELLGPAIEAEGYAAVVPRALARFRELWA